MTKDKIKASHILVMHNESRDSRSNITKEKAVNKINSLYLRAIYPDDHFIQEPLASVIQHEAR